MDRSLPQIRRISERLAQHWYEIICFLRVFEGSVLSQLIFFFSMIAPNSWRCLKPLAQEIKDESSRYAM
jgi:hypothetical protein